MAAGNQHGRTVLRAVVVGEQPREVDQLRPLGQRRRHAVGVRVQAHVAVGVLPIGGAACLDDRRRALQDDVASAHEPRDAHRDRVQRRLDEGLVLEQPAPGPGPAPRLGVRAPVLGDLQIVPFGQDAQDRFPQAFDQVGCAHPFRRHDGDAVGVHFQQVPFDTEPPRFQANGVGVRDVAECRYVHVSSLVWSGPLQAYWSRPAWMVGSTCCGRSTSSRYG